MDEKSKAPVVEDEDVAFDAAIADDLTEDDEDN